MTEPALVIPPTPHSPAVYIHVNPLYTLYHYLVSQGQLPREEQNPAMRAAADRAAGARHLLGPHGVWDVWEGPLASSANLDEAVAGLTGAMTETVDALGSALRAAEGVFLEAIWPERQAIIADALETIGRSLRPAFDAMASWQAHILDLVWPPRLDLYLVTDCYDRQGAYSHPLTVDATAFTGLTLCETVLHEATHVADVYTTETGKESLHDRVIVALTTSGISPSAAWNVWHAIIFAASGSLVRYTRDMSYTPFAAVHDLYARLGVPDLPALWEQREGKVIDEVSFLRALVEQVARNSA